MLAGGLELLPGSALHVSPTAGGFALAQFAKPVKLAFAFGPLSEANLAVFAKDGRTVTLSGLGGTLQLERR